MSIYENFIRPLLFNIEPEKAHSLVVSLLERAGRSTIVRESLRRRFEVSNRCLETTVCGIRFPNPVGLAAGFDKDCRLGRILPALGFGFLELGTITPLAQPGNPRPRIVRLPESRALINRLGFNNEGAQEAAHRLQALASHTVPVGINIGKGKETPSEQAVDDYRQAFSTLAPMADYVAINVSSPNTRGLRDLQEKEQLANILSALRGINKQNKPIFVKLSPDLTKEQLDEICPVLLQQADGVIVSNTTISREDVPAQYSASKGGLSGVPLKAKSTRLVSDIYGRTGGKLPIIGVGGVFTAEDAFEKILAGASLVQIYTGMIYRGPGIVKDILDGLVRLVSQRGLKTVSEAVGLQWRQG